MWPDRTYVLFTYERLRDVRLVYAPPMSLGCFGGDTDNFEWPRHTADFTLLRAYVAPDGAAAEHSPDNVPYKPQRFLRAATRGVSPGDFVCLLGFPGSTMRYAPASRLAYSDQVAVPQLVSDFIPPHISPYLPISRGGGAPAGLRLRGEAAAHRAARHRPRHRAQARLVPRRGLHALLLHTP